MSVNVSFFGNMPDGKEVRLFTVKNSNGIILQVITLGATLQALYTPDNTAELTISQSALTAFTVILILRTIRAKLSEDMPTE